MKGDPTRDPASEARDDWEQLCQPLTDEERRENARKIEALSVPDRFALMFGNASEPRATPETDAASFSTVYQGELVKASFARRLERQRDELLEACKECDDAFSKFCPDLDSRYGMAWGTVKAAIAAVKGYHT